MENFIPVNKKNMDILDSEFQENPPETLVNKSYDISPGNILEILNDFNKFYSPDIYSPLFRIDCNWYTDYIGIKDIPITGWFSIDEQTNNELQTNTPHRLLLGLLIKTPINEKRTRVRIVCFLPQYKWALDYFSALEKRLNEDGSINLENYNLGNSNHKSDRLQYPTWFPKRLSTRRSWGFVYSIFIEMWNEYKEEYFDGQSDEPIPRPEDVVDRMKLLDNVVRKGGKKYSKRTIRYIIKAGREGWLKKYMPETT